VRSALPKVAALTDLIVDCSLDSLALTETWIGSSESDTELHDLAPQGFAALHATRATGRGGGLALIYNQSLNFKKVTINELDNMTSFEYLYTELNTSHTQKFNFLIIYRTPSTSPYLFIMEFSHCLDIITNNNIPLLI
jgi:hypothetical protein